MIRGLVTVTVGVGCFHASTGVLIIQLALAFVTVGTWGIVGRHFVGGVKPEDPGDIAIRSKSLPTKAVHNDVSEASDPTV